MKHHHSLQGGAMKPGWAILITVLVLGAVAGIICGIYFGTLNKVDKYVPPINKSSTSAPQPKLDKIVVSPGSVPVDPSTKKAVRACTGCTDSQQCVNNTCTDICFGKWKWNMCSADGCPPAAGVPTRPCACSAGSTCGTDGTCSVAGKACNPTCPSGQTCQPDGTCFNPSSCSQPCPTGQVCKSGSCVIDSSCPTLCQAPEVCVSGTCKCQPNCSANSCGSDGCGGQCPCSAGQTCNSSQQCVSCVPNCPKDGTCGSADGCNGTCGCPGGQVCQGGKCVADSDPWVGWTSTTQFGAGEDTWGSSSPVVYLPSVNSPDGGTLNGVTVGRMGGAMPWKTICNYGSKQDQIQSVVDSAAGRNTDKACLLVQPINKYPDQISGVTDPMFASANMCDSSKGPCTDVNDDSIVALDVNGNKYPPYLIVPYEGCGGDCMVTAGSGPDCINGCLTGTDQLPGVECKWNDLQGPLCGAAKVMYDNGNWGWNPTIEKNFLQYSRPIAISAGTDYGRNISAAATGGHANYCSGQNQHVDMAITVPYWVNIQPSADPSKAIAQLTADTNIMMRYKHVPCNYLGNIDVDAPPSPDMSCPNGFWSIKSTDTCGETRLKPGDAAWPNSSGANHDCCGAPIQPHSSQCGAGQVYQPTGGACPCPRGSCFFNTTKPIDGSNGLCGQCNLKQTSPGVCTFGTPC